MRYWAENEQDQQYLENTFENGDQPAFLVLVTYQATAGVLHSSSNASTFFCEIVHRQHLQLYDAACHIMPAHLQTASCIPEKRGPRQDQWHQLVLNRPSHSNLEEAKALLPFPPPVSASSHFRAPQMDASS